jgi:hypothetical protein
MEKTISIFQVNSNDYLFLTSFLLLNLFDIDLFPILIVLNVAIVNLDG